MSTYTFKLPLFRASDEPFSVFDKTDREVAIIQRTYRNVVWKGIEYAVRNWVFHIFTPFWIDMLLSRLGVQAKVLWNGQTYIIQQKYGVVLDYWNIIHEGSLVGVIREADLTALGDMLEIAWGGETYVMERQMLHNKTHVYRAQQIEVAVLHSPIMDVNHPCTLTIIEDSVPAPVIALTHYLNHIKGLS